MALDDSLFKGRIIKVNPKRTNRPGISTTNRGRGRARGRSVPYMARGGAAPWINSFRGARSTGIR